LTRLVILLAVAGDQERQEVRSVSETEPSSGRSTQDIGSEQWRDQVLSELRDPSFPIAVRGYERHAVDAYVERVNRVIAELDVGGSPLAVRHALDRAGEQIGGVLQHARQAAEQITAEALAEAEATTVKARTDAQQTVMGAKAQAHELREQSTQQADEMLARAREHAAELIRRAEEEARAVQEQAEPRIRELEADTEAVWDTRRKLLEELPRMATELMEIAGAANARVRPPRDKSDAPAQWPEGAQWTHEQARPAPAQPADLDRDSAPIRERLTAPPDRPEPTPSPTTRSAAQGADPN
jgi:cell division septum initiation protein DivIVA